MAVSLSQIQAIPTLQEVEQRLEEVLATLFASENKSEELPASASSESKSVTSGTIEDINYLLDGIFISFETPLSPYENLYDTWEAALSNYAQMQEKEFFDVLAKTRENVSQENEFMNASMDELLAAEVDAAPDELAAVSQGGHFGTVISVPRDLDTSALILLENTNLNVPWLVLQQLTTFSISTPSITSSPFAFNAPHNEISLFGSPPAQFSARGAIFDPPITLLSNIHDIDPNATLSVLGVIGEHGQYLLGVPVILPSGAIVQVFEDGSFYFNPLPNASLATLPFNKTSLDGFDYGVKDSNGNVAVAHANVSVFVDPLAVPPTLDFSAIISKLSVLTGSDSVFNPSNLLFKHHEASPIDIFKIVGIEINNGTVLKVGSEGLSLTLNDGAHFFIHQNGSFEFDPTIAPTFQNLTRDQSLVESLSFIVENGHGLSNSANPSTLTITVAGSSSPTNNVAPIVFDLNDDGIHLGPASDAVLLLNIPGVGASHIGSVGTSDGILVLNYDGGSQLTLNEISFANVALGAKTDLQGLALFDVNHDGVINNSDNIYHQLGVFQDVNGDGKVDNGDYHSLAQLGITSISLTSDNIQQIQSGNLIYGMGTYQTADGYSHALADAGLSIGSAANDPLAVLNVPIEQPHVSISVTPVAVPAAELVHIAEQASPILHQEPQNQTG